MSISESCPYKKDVLLREVSVLEMCPSWKGIHRSDSQSKRRVRLREEHVRCLQTVGCRDFKIVDYG